MSRSRPRRRLVAALSGIALLIVVAASGPPLRAQTTVIASVASDGTKGNLDSIDPAISPDGRYVAFASHATNLDPLDPKSLLDVYWRDLETGTTMVVSKSTGGVLGDRQSFHPGISRDGAFVVYMSDADNLVAGDTNRVRDIFLFEVATATTTRISVDSGGGQADKMSLDPVISADATRIAYTSLATNLVANDTNGFTDVFLYDVATGTTGRVSVDSSGSQANGNSDSPALSADGNRVVFVSRASNLVAHDANGHGDVFLRDVAAGTTVRVSVGDQGQESDSESMDPGISGDGNVVGFRSIADNLVPGDVNQKFDAFVNDLAAGTVERVSVSSEEVEADHDTFDRPALSFDGRFVTFLCGATNLVDDPVLVNCGFYARDRGLGITTWVGRGDHDQDGDQPGQCLTPAISDDGSRVVFATGSSGLVALDDDPYIDVFVRERDLSPASASGYGAGTAGELGVPSLDASATPFLDSDFDLIVGNSTAWFTIGILVLGAAPQDLTVRGGTLLVDPLVCLPIALSPGSTDFGEHVPPDELLAGETVYLQALELDAAAPRGVSFTPGLALTPGF
jgi:Tol biopolymer transport system component